MSTGAVHRQVQPVSSAGGVPVSDRHQGMARSVAQHTSGFLLVPAMAIEASRTSSIRRHMASPWPQLAGGEKQAFPRSSSRLGYAVAHFLTVSQVRVVTRAPKTFLIRVMSTGPRGFGT